MRIAWVLLLAPFGVLAQSVPNSPITQGQVWTPAQWNDAWASKQDWDANIPVSSGVIAPGNCAQWQSASPPILVDAGITCSGGGGGETLVSITAPMHAGTTDNYAPIGYSAGVTNQIIFVPASGGSILGGLIAPGISGFEIDGYNGSATDTLTLLTASVGSSSGNQLLVPTDMGPTVIPPLAGFKLRWMASILSGVSYWTVRQVQTPIATATILGNFSGAAKSPTGITTTGTGSVVMSNGAAIDLTNAFNIPPQTLAPCAAYTVLSNNTASSAIPLCNGSLTIQNLSLGNLAVSGNQSPANSWIYENATMTGTATSNFTPKRFAPIFLATTDSVYTSGGALTGQVFSYQNLVSGWGGYRNNFNLYTLISSPPSPADAWLDDNIVGMNVLVNVNSSLGGVSGCWTCAQGSVFAFNPNLFANASANATNIALYTTAEFDTLLAAGSSAEEKHALTLVTGPADAVQGTMDDSALLIATQDNTGTSAWATGIQIGNVAHSAPFNALSTIIGASRRMLGPVSQPIALWGIDWRNIAFQSGGGFLASQGFEVDPSGNLWPESVNLGPGGITSATAVVASLGFSAYGGFTGGAYYDTGGFPAIVIDASPSGGTNATATVATMTLTSAILNFSGGVPAAATDAGCSNGDVLTLAGETGTATVTLTVVGGSVTAVSITNAGTITAKTATITTTGGTCTSQPTIDFGFGIATTTVTNPGTGYPCNPAPRAHTTGYTATVNTPARFSITMTCTAQPITFSQGPHSAPSWGTTGLIVGSSGTQALTDTTATDAAATLPAWSLPVYNFLCTTGPCTTTALAELYIPPPLNTDGNFASATLYSIFTPAGGNVKFGGTENVIGLITGTGGAIISGANVVINSGSSFTTTLNAAASSGGVSIIGGTGSGVITIGNSGNTGNTQLQGLSTGTAADTLCLSASGVVLLVASNSCGVSSVRFKHDIADFSGDALSELLKFHVIDFKYSDHNRDLNYYSDRLGISAEEVDAIEPRCAYYEQDLMTPKSYLPECIGALTLRGVQQLSVREQADTAALIIVVKSQDAAIRKQQWEIYGLALWCLGLTAYLLRRRNVK